MTELLIGTYPPDGPGGEPGSGEGVWLVTLDEATGTLAGRLAAPTPAPSFLAVTPDRRSVVTAGETSPGRVTAFDLAGGNLVERAVVGSGGSGTCHVLVHPGGGVAYLANYESGSVSVVPLDAGCGVSGGVAQVFEHSGRSAHPDRQDGPHAHSTMLAPGGRHLLAADLGTDEVRRYRVGEQGLLEEAGLAVTLPAGTGPRHMALGPAGTVYVVGELDGAVHVLRWEQDELHPVQVLPAAPGPDAGLPGHVLVAGDELLVSVRGPDVVSRFRIGAGGNLDRIGELTLPGSWPRHFAVVGPWAVVALQEDDAVVAVPRRPELAECGPGGRLEVPVPACVVPVG